MNREFNFPALLKSTISLSFEPSYKLKAKFHILDVVDSTNNYAMARINDGLAQHGETWFAHEQTSGRGQPGKNWISDRGKNLMMSIIVRPNQTLHHNIFQFNALVSTVIRDFIQKWVTAPVFLKWPNDFYLDDRKAGGMLIENKFQGDSWKWSVIGIGINVNQKQFEAGNNAISLCSKAEMKLIPEELAHDLQNEILDNLHKQYKVNFDDILCSYNDKLYKKNEFVTLRIDDCDHQSKILEVDRDGYLMVEIQDRERKIRHGEARWIFCNNM